RNYFDRLDAWCRAHAGMKPDDLDLDVLKTTTSANEFESAARKRAEAKDQRAAPLILTRVDEFPQWKSDLIRYLYLLDTAEPVSRARAWVAEPLDGPETWWSPNFTRNWLGHLYAGLILLRHGDRQRLEGLDVVDAILSVDREGYYTRIAKPELDS